MAELPKKYDHKIVEDKWKSRWTDLGVYKYDAARSRQETFVVDTPPPTVSGSLHVGHVFSYTHTDLIVRYKRMCGMNIMYPMGWDDNGLATERRVQNKLGIQCNPELPYNASWKPRDVVKDGEREEVSRQNFIEACALVTGEDEKAFEDLWRTLSLSVDWSENYATVDKHCIRTSQYSFLDLYKKGQVYNAESATMWDVDFKTALAQADIEDRPKTGNYHDIRFGIEEGGEFTISTTRPELLVACVAVVAHPEDKRFQKYFGKFAITPLFSARVPILPSEHADPEKGTGILMVCTFGDIADVQWWKPSGLPIKQVLGRDGRFLPVEFETGTFKSSDATKAQTAYSQILGKSVEQARKITAKLLAEPGSAADGKSPALIGEPKATEQIVKFYEKGDRPVEFITTRQWFTKILDHKEDLLKQGEKIAWHPHHMRVRYEHWVNGINQDWCISRQRFFGVPFPVWYPVKDSGVVDYQNPILATVEMLPVDPLSVPAPGYKDDQRGKPGGFVGDPDVMDTWATSSLTPQITSHWDSDAVRHQKLFPADMRPQSHEIIRTWAFYTIAKAWLHEKELPWKNIVISGWILDPDRKKMSKSKGNVVTPMHLLEKYSADGVRYWAARARLGVDTAFDEKVFAMGQKLSNKLFNASKFVLMQVESFEQAGGKTSLTGITEEIDRCLIEELRKCIKHATTSFEKFDYAAALQAAEDIFWQFCDHYIEIVKGRSYSESDMVKRGSAVSTLEYAINVFLRLFAPAMPFVTEEIWSWHFADGEKSIHKSAWPSIDELKQVETPASQNENLLSMVSDVVAKIYSVKSTEQRSLRTPVEKLEVVTHSKDIAILKAAENDIMRAGHCVPEKISFIEGTPANGQNFEITVTLAAPEPASGS